LSGSETADCFIKGQVGKEAYEYQRRRNRMWNWRSRWGSRKLLLSGGGCERINYMERGVRLSRAPGSAEGGHNGNLGQKRKARKKIRY